MEGFTLVLLIGWVILVGAFAGMYFMDQASQQAAAHRAAQASEKKR